MRKGKADVKYAKFNKESSVVQQEAYLSLADEVEQNFPNIHVLKIDNMKPVEETKKYIKNILM